MNLREWARVTHQVLASQPPHERYKDLSVSDVERVMRVAITTLVAALINGEELKIDALGRLWPEHRPARRMINNLTRRPQAISLSPRRAVRFRSSNRLTKALNKPFDGG